MNNKPPKYEILPEPYYRHGDRPLYRIRALRDFGIVKAGQLGGLIAGPDNLSQEGECWVTDEACVWDNAQVRRNAWVENYASVGGCAVVSGNAIVGGSVSIEDSAYICGDATLFGRCYVRDKAHITGCATISAGGRIAGNAFIKDNAEIEGDVDIKGNVVISGCASLKGFIFVHGDVVIGRTTHLCGRCVIGDRLDFFTMVVDPKEPVWSSTYSATSLVRDGFWCYGDMQLTTAQFYELVGKVKHEIQNNNSEASQKA